jgi:hypothetical protein
MTAAVWATSSVGKAIFVAGDDALQPRPADQMLAEGGVAFEDWTSAALAYPMLWRTAGAAREAFRRARGANVITNPSSVRFQRAGNGQGVQRACYDLRRVDNPRAEIERMVGPLAMFEAEGQEAAPEAEGATLASRILAALAGSQMQRRDLMRKAAQRTGSREHPARDRGKAQGLLPPLPAEAAAGARYGY